MKIQDAIEGFLIDRSSAKCSPPTLRWYRYKLSMFAGAMERQGVTEIEQLRVQQLRAFVLELQETVADTNNPYKPARADGAKLSDLTVRGFVQVIKTFCKWLYMEELLEEDPSLRLRRPKTRSYVIKTFSAANIEDMLAECDRRSHIGFRDYTIILLFCDTGIRLGELCKLRVDNVHISTGGESSYIKVLGKGDKEREVGLSPAVAKTMWKYMTVHRQVKESPEKRVFIGRYGKPITSPGVQAMLRTIKRKVGLEGLRVSPHTFRHTFSNMYVEAGGKVERLSRELGHSKIVVTEQYLKQFSSHSARDEHDKFSPVQNLNLGKRRGAKDGREKA